MLNRGPQLLAAAFSDNSSQQQQNLQPGQIKEQSTHPLLISLQEGSRFYARMLKMSWVHDKKQIETNEFAQFFEGEITKSITGIEMLVELVSEVANNDEEIFSPPSHRRVRMQFSREPLLNCVKVAFHFLKAFNDGTYDKMSRLHFINFFCYLIFFVIIIVNQI